jgi:hypothetical protein
VIGVVWFLGKATRVSPGMRTALLVAATCAELLWISHRCNLYYTREALYPDSGALRVMQQRLGPPDFHRFMVWGTWKMLPPNLSSIWGLSDVRGYLSLPVSRWRFLLETAEGADFDNIAVLKNPESPIYRLLSIGYQLVPRGVNTAVFETDERVPSMHRRRDSLPRAFLVHDVRSVPDLEAMRAALRDRAFDPGRVAYLLKDVPLPSVAPATGPEQVVIERMEERAVHLRVDASAPGMLVLSDVFYPGWKAEVNGRPERILPANHGVRGIPIPAGVHFVRIEYAPSWFPLGLAGTGLGLIACLGLAFAPQNRRRGASPASRSGSGPASRSRRASR